MTNLRRLAWTVAGVMERHQDLELILLFSGPRVTVMPLNWPRPEFEQLTAECWALDPELEVTSTE